VVVAAIDMIHVSTGQTANLLRVIPYVLAHATVMLDDSGANLRDPVRGEAFTPV
jgi:hypothetical protein